MTSTNLSDLTAQGIAAVKTGHRIEARQIFEFVLSQDKANVAAWWWLAQVIDDQQASHKCLNNARSAAVQSEQGFAVYRSLLEASNALKLPRYRLAEKSKSLGGICPICTTTPKVGEIVVICPECGLAHHSECWENDAYHCGRFACEGSGLIDSDSPVQVESAATSAGTLIVGDEEIPEETRLLTREQQEARFVGKLQQHVLTTLLRQALIEGVVRESLARQEEEQRREEAQQKQMELAARVTFAFLASLIPGILLAIATYRHSQDWWLTLFVIYLTMTGIATAVARTIEEGRTASAIYWLLPQVAAIGILFAAFDRWDKGFLAVIVAYLGGVFVVERILRLRPLYHRRVFIAYSVLALTGMAVLRVIVS